MDNKEKIIIQEEVLNLLYEYIKSFICSGVTIEEHYKLCECEEQTK